MDKVTINEVKRVAQELFREELVRLAVIGPYEDEERFSKLLKF